MNVLDSSTQPTFIPSQNPVPIAIARGDGIGPEIMEATLSILRSAGAQLHIQEIEIGEKVYRQGLTSGIAPESWEILRGAKAFLKAPITTPQGGGFKSLNVTIRKSLGLYANVRPCTAYAPFVPTDHPGMNLVVVRENEEDLYAGIEHRQTEDVYQCLKLITRAGCERVVRYAFEYARAYGRQKVTCMTKDNIMKLTDGLFHKVYDEIGAEYPDIKKEHWIIDIGMARAATRPEMFDVIVTPNLYGDILSDVTAEAAGSVGLAGSANIGEHLAMFEAIHGSAPDIAGKDVANPSGLILAAVMMLVHVGQPAVAEKIHNALLSTLEEGILTPDVWSSETGRFQVGTRAFAEAVILRLGSDPEILTPVRYSGMPSLNLPKVSLPPLAKKETVGVDVFISSRLTPNELAAQLQGAAADGPALQMITSRGVKVWPNGLPETSLTDHWRCRFQSPAAISQTEILALLGRIDAAGLEIIKTENLCLFDGVPGYSLGQGQ